MQRKILWAILAIASVVFIISLTIDLFHPPSLETPINRGIATLYATDFAPPDRVKESQIKVYEDRIVIDLQNAKWAKFADTNSMIPFLDEGSNALQIEPVSPSDIQVGDIISYEYGDNVIIHRVIDIKEDGQGTYYVTKGDSNELPDPVKVRYHQVRRILVGIIY